MVYPQLPPDAEDYEPEKVDNETETPMVFIRLDDCKEYAELCRLKTEYKKLWDRIRGFNDEVKNVIGDKDIDRIIFLTNEMKMMQKKYHDTNARIRELIRLIEHKYVFSWKDRMRLERNIYSWWPLPNNIID